MRRAAREWVEKAESDFISAGREFRARKQPNYDAACFFVQQCLEKYLKARLAEADRKIPRTHDLSALLDLLLPIEPLWEGHRSRLEKLSSYAVVFRYPGESATRELAKQAIADCKVIRLAIRNSLRLPKS
jgi:HEPN domain-containing protein